MFLLDLYKFAETHDWFNIQYLARFIYKHRECERLSRSAGVTPRYFASVASREFIARMATLGYLSIENGVVRCLGASKRPFGFDLMSLEGDSNSYVRNMMNVGDMSDEELFSTRPN